MKRCSRCREMKSLGEFHRSTRSSDGRALQCRPCKKATDARRYQRHKVTHKAAVRRWEREFREWLADLKRGPCADCGGTFHPAAMQWDHLPEFEKLMAVSRMTGMSKERVLAEIAKCELVCANCHAVRTYNRQHTMARWPSG